MMDITYKQNHIRVIEAWYQWLTSDKAPSEKVQKKILHAIADSCPVRDVIMYSALFPIPLDKQLPLVIPEIKSETVRVNLCEAWETPLDVERIHRVQHLLDQLEAIAQTPAEHVTLESVYAYLAWWLTPLAPTIEQGKQEVNTHLDKISTLESGEVEDYRLTLSQIITLALKRDLYPKGAVAQATAQL